MLKEVESYRFEDICLLISEVYINYLTQIRPQFEHGYIALKHSQEIFRITASFLSVSRQRERTLSFSKIRNRLALQSLKAIQGELLRANTLVLLD